jgi:hypothetical protein
VAVVNYIFPPDPRVLVMPRACFGFIAGWSGDGYALEGADNACACQYCAGHRWTCCGECGRDGDRPGDECESLCEQHSPA